MRATGEVRQVELGGTVKVLESEMGAMGRGRAGMDNYLSPQNLGTTIVTISRYNE